MNIKTFVEYLNKTRGYSIPTDHYTRIELWRDWWKGFHKPFHEYTEVDGDLTVKRRLFTLKMAKKVCEDWAAILLNEKTTIVLGNETSSKFLQGDDGTGGVFGANGFWAQGNALIEKAFATGTGAFVVKLSGMRLGDDAVVVKDSDTKIVIDYLPATCIIPLTVRQGRIIEVAFVSEVMERGKTYLYLESHLLEGTEYSVKNEYFLTENEQITPAPLPPGIAPKVSTGSDIPLFAIISPNIVNTYDKANGLGMSVYAHAIDNLQGVDLAFNNFCRDFKLGGKKVFYDQAITRVDAEGNVITPDDVMQQLFVQIGEGMVDEQGRQKAVQEFNPSLRVTENKDGLQAQLDYLSFKVGFGTKHYQFNGNSIVTATQYMGDKQELVQNASKHYIVVEQSLKQLIRAVLWAGKEILGQPIDPDTKVTVKFEDGYIIDKDSERLRDQGEVRDDLMMPWEFRVKWYGETEEKAKKILAEKRSGEGGLFEE